MYVHPVNPAGTERPSSARKVAKAVVTTAAVAGTVVYLSKTGKLSALKNAVKEKLAGFKFMESLGRKFSKVQDFVKAQAEKVQNSKLMGKAKEGIAKVKDSSLVANVKENFAKIKDSGLVAKIKTIPGRVMNFVSTLADKVEARINPEKFL